MSGDPTSFVSPVEVIDAAMTGETDTVPEGYSANALVLAASGQPGEQHLCERLLSALAPVNVIGVAIKNDRSYYHEQADRMETEPARLGVVEVGGPDAAATDQVKPVSEAGDLTGLGISVMHFVKEWATTDEPTVVCFDSLTPLLQYSEPDRVYRFLDVTTRRLDRVCAVSHAHINPLAHDERTVQQLMSVFDAVVEPETDGEPTWTARRS
jgi:hypothetical protein